MDDERVVGVFSRNVYELACSKMKEAAAELGVEAEIWAVAQDKALVEIEKADVLLVGPQMRFMKKKYEAKGKEVGVPVEMIDAVAYGRVDGMAVDEAGTRTS